jgi:hypothetical protein
VRVRSIRVLCALIMVTTLSACDGSSSAAPQVQMNPTVATLDDFGRPLAGILSEAASGQNQDLRIFATGQQTFTLVHKLPTMGPLFDSRSCAACHFQPSLGGSAEFIQEVRVRSTGLVAQVFAVDNILRLGPQLQGSNQIFESGVKFDTLAPLSKWQISGRFDTAEHCHLAVKLRSIGISTIQRKKRRPGIEGFLAQGVACLMTTHA